MRTFLLLILILLFPNHLFLHEKTAAFANSLQKNCAELVPKSLQNRELAQSFICGTALKQSEAKSIFQKTGLLHLMVVSGSHLQVIAFFILLPFPVQHRKDTWLLIFLWTLLFAYCLITGFQAPVIRAFASRILQSLNRFFRWNWDFGKVQLAIGLILLSLFPTWILSLSFFLSWLASLGFLLTPLYSKRENAWKTKVLEIAVTCFCVQTLIAFCFSSFSFLSVVTNALLAPFISFLLFPLSFASFLFPAAVPLVDQGWDFLLEILKKISLFDDGTESSFSFRFSNWRWITLWTFLAAVHVFFEILRRHRYRSSNV